MSNLKVRPKQVDFSKMSPEYAKVEICTRVPVDKMKKELIHQMYIDFKDDSQMYMRHLDIVKKEHKLRNFDTLSPNGESKLLLYLGVYLNTWSTDEIKKTYIDKVLEGVIPYYE
jgi:hypothetical protein